MRYIQPSELKTFITNLTETEMLKIAEKSFFHPHQFYRILLKMTSDGYATRLHVWKRPKEPTPQYPHDHGWNFTSHLLFGEIAEKRYSVTEGSAYYCKQGVDDAKGSHLECNFGENGQCDLQVDQINSYQEGDTYYMASDQIHTAGPVTSTAVTLVHQEPLHRDCRLFVPITDEEFTCEAKFPPLSVKELKEIFENVIKLIELVSTNYSD